MSNAMTVAKGIVSNMSDPAVLLDTEFQMVCHSSAYPSLVGLRPRQMSRKLKGGLTTFDLVGDDPTTAMRTAEQAMREQKALHFAEEKVCNHEGNHLTVCLSYLPIIDNDGNTVGVIQSFRDVSAEARMQVRYRELLGQERMRAEQLEREVTNRTRELTAALEEVTRLSRVDPLTGLLNRRAFTELAEQAIKLAKRHGRSMGLLLGDIDFFKKVNDNWGHMIGDKILVASAKKMRIAVRDSDPVARFGGEEFVVLLTETERDAVSIVGERVRKAIASITNDDLDGEEGPSPTMSLGMAVFPDHGDTLDDLVLNADKALYRAKETGRNRTVMYVPGEMEQDSEVEGESKRPMLIVGSRRSKQFEEKLSESFDITSVAGEEAALLACQHTNFDVLVADHDSAEDGVEFLRRSQRNKPEALRVLVIDNKEVFLEVRGANLARVDSFLLRGEAIDHMSTAIDDALARREQDRNRMLMQTDSVRRLFESRLSELDELLKKKELEFAYQPIMDPRSGEVYAYEALCRARHPIFQNPQVLFDAAVQSGCLWQLGRVAREVAVKGLEKLPPNVKLFLNLHPGEVDDPHLLEFADRKTAERIVFEITERASIPDYTRFREMTTELSKQGFQFAVDDLGAGYAGLNAVALLSPEYIKIDMAMVRGIDLAPRRAKLIRRIVDFANDVGIKLVAEGVETPQEAAAVAELGCHLSQGYFFGRPHTEVKPATATPAGARRSSAKPPPIPTVKPVGTNPGSGKSKG